MVALGRGDPLIETVLFALILTVAAIPVALPAVLSVTMAVGAEKLARLKAIVSRLVAIEELAGIDVLCADKTGTLTQNRLTLGEPVVIRAADADDLLLAAALASRAEGGDAIDQAVMHGLDRPARLATYRVTAFQPFDPVSKRTEATIVHEGATAWYTKGAPQVILALAQPDAALTRRVEDAVTTLAARGDRTLGVARRDQAEEPWRFLGLLALFDPPREDAAKTIALARRMGVAIKMVTGDHQAIAREIAGKLGLGQTILPAAEMFKPGGDVPDPAAIEAADGFAQVFPEHKYAIVKALQARDHNVGMTGDGVNDAPALKQADAGIAVSGATDDLALPAPYDADHLAGKQAAKAALRHQLRLDPAANGPLVVVVNRLTHQKMADVVLEALPAVLDQGVQVVLHGEGDPGLEAAFRAAAIGRESRLAVRIGYQETLAHRLNAAADLALTPSRFEPCGLTTMYAMRYGALPVTRSVGGLADTVTDIDTAHPETAAGTGFTFDDPTAAALAGGVRRAGGLFRDPVAWRRVQRAAMVRDFGWEVSARRYLALYGDLMVPEVQTNPRSLILPAVGDPPPRAPRLPEPIPLEAAE